MRRFTHCLPFTLIVFCVCLAVLSAAGAGAEANTGTIEGVVQYRADPGRPWQLSRYYVRPGRDGFLAESVVALEGSTLGAVAPACAPSTHSIDQINFQFVPETLAIRAGDSVRITNSDEALHNVTTSDGASPFNMNVSRGQDFTRTFEHASGLSGPLRLSCVFHGNMRAWIYVFDHPWFQVTGQSGRFHFDNVPVGDYSLGIVHPAGKLRLTRQIHINPNATTTVSITLTPDDLIGSKTKAN